MGSYIGSLVPTFHFLSHTHIYAFWPISTNYAQRVRMRLRLLGYPHVPAVRAPIVTACPVPSAYSRLQWPAGPAGYETFFWAPTYDLQKILCLKPSPGRPGVTPKKLEATDAPVP